MRSLIAALLTVGILLSLLGCSSYQKSEFLAEITPVYNSSDSLPVIAFDGTSAIGMLGQFTLSISPDGVDATLSPARTSMLGESYIVSGKGFFVMSPCTDCLKVKNIALDRDGNIVLGMVVKHPFPKGDVFKPPSGKNRLDLDVFDLALLMDPVEMVPQAYPLTGSEVYPGILLNADGYSKELASIASERVIPYKICFEDVNNNRFEMGNDYQSFDLVVAAGGGVTFNLYLTMGYGASAKKAQRLMPTYYVPEFNRKSAWKVVVTPPQGTNPPDITNTWNSADTTTTHDVTIDIYDWNHGATISPIFPDPTNTNQISAESNVGSVTVEIPGMTSSIITAVTSDSSFNGWDDPLTYTASIANQNGLAAGDYFGIVKVTDTRNPGESFVGGESDTIVHTPDGILLQWHNIPEFATYQVFKATVVEMTVCDPPVPTSIDPTAFTTAPGIYNDVSIIGNYFTGSGGVTQVYLDNSIDQIYATDINVISDTKLTCDFDVSTAQLGTYDVVVFTACEGRGVGLLDINGSWPQEWSCFQYNSYNIGQNPNPQNFDYSSCTQKWYTPSDGFKYSGPAVTQDYAYVCTNLGFYSTSGYHRLVCFNISDGSIKWEKYINPTGDYARAFTSPAYFDDGSNGRVVIGGDRVWCFDAITGDVEWEYGLSYIFIASSPKILDGKAYIAGSGFYHCLDVMTGAVQWTSVPGTGGGESTAAVVDGRLYSGYGTSYNCLDITDGSIVWQKTSYPGTSHWDAPLVLSDRLYYASYNQVLMCLDTNTGDMIWQYTESTTSAWISSLTYWIDPSDGKTVIYFSAAFGNGGVWAIKDMGTSPQKLWKSQDFYADASPVFNDGVIYIGDVNSNVVYAFDCVTGAQLTTFPVNSVRGAVGFAFGRMIVPATSGVYCFE